MLLQRVQSIQRFLGLDLTLFVAVSLLYYYLDQLSVQYFYYNFVLLTGVLYGLIHFPKLTRMARFITLLFLGVFLLESTMMFFRVLEINNRFNYLLITVFLYALNYLIFSLYLKFSPKGEKRFYWVSLGFLFLIIFNPSVFSRDYSFPFLSVAIFCIYTIVLCLLSFVQLMESPSYIPLAKNPVFLFSFANVLIYCVKFWSLSFRPVLYKLPLEILIEYRLMVFDLSTICLDMGYTVMLYIIFLKPKILVEGKKG